MGYSFDVIKTAQALALMMRVEGVARMSRMRVCKLLYFADRESIKEHAAPISGDGYAALQHGPVLSNTLRLCQGRGDARLQAQWNAFFSSSGNYVVLETEPGTGCLSPRETRILSEIAAKYAKKSESQLRNESHCLKEWKEAYPGDCSSGWIELEAILRGVGREKDVEAVLAQREEDRAVDAFLKENGVICV